MPNTHCDETDATPLLAGALIGAGAASAIDAAALAYEPTPRPSNEGRHYGVLSQLRIAPRIGLSHGAPSLGVVGVF